MATNFQFAVYLNQSPLPESERADLERIFATLRPERQVEIIDAWPKYLEKILEIKHYADTEKKRIMLDTFTKIDAILDDANLRAQQAEREAAEHVARLAEEAKTAAEYDAGRRLEALKNLGRAPEGPDSDPLAAFRAHVRPLPAQDPLSAVADSGPQVPEDPLAALVGGPSAPAANPVPVGDPLAAFS